MDRIQQIQMEDDAQLKEYHFELRKDGTSLGYFPGRSKADALDTYNTYNPNDEMTMGRVRITLHNA